MQQEFHLAQVNIARAKASLEHPLMQGFVEQLDGLNRLAESSPGFVWRLQGEEGDATALRLFEDERIIVNLSLWHSVEALKSYVYGGAHLEALRNKKSWFEKMDQPALALWWVPAGRLPSLESAQQALASIQRHGATPAAFTFARPYPAPAEMTFETDARV